MGLIERLAGQRVYLDANVFIYAVEGSAVFAEVLPPLLAAVAQSTQAAVTSELALAEVLVHPFRDGDRRREEAFTRAVRTHGGLTVVPVSRAVLVEAARLRAAFPTLKLPDAIHAATARLNACGVLLTNDARFAAIPGVEILQLSEAVGG